MEPIVSSETSAIKTQTPGNYPKRNKLHLEHGESLKTKFFSCLSMEPWCCLHSSQKLSIWTPTQHFETHYLLRQDAVRLNPVIAYVSHGFFFFTYLLPAFIINQLHSLQETRHFSNFEIWMWLLRKNEAVYSGRLDCTPLLAITV